MADPKILETFPNPQPGRDYLIEHTHHEFTSLCPITGHPDFAEITVQYVADKICVELKVAQALLPRLSKRGDLFRRGDQQDLRRPRRAAQAATNDGHFTLDGARRIYVGDQRGMAAEEAASQVAGQVEGSPKNRLYGQS